MGMVGGGTVAIGAYFFANTIIIVGEGLIEICVEKFKKELTAPVDLKKARDYISFCSK
jgi:hypothetical protein